MKSSFSSTATTMQRSNGLRHRYKGNQVMTNGYPRSFNHPAGGNSPRFDKRRGIKHGPNWRNYYWERNGERSSPPANQQRGWK